MTIVSSIRTDSKSADTRSLQIRIQTTDVILKDDEKAAEVTLSIPHQKDVLALTATGSIKGKTNLIVISIPAEAKMLPSFSRGSSAIVKIPTAMGEKQLEVDLKGSGAAVKELASRCG